MKTLERVSKHYYYIIRGALQMGKVRLNEDREIVARVKEGLKRKEGYCPCRLEIKRKR